LRDSAGFAPDFAVDGRPRWAPRPGHPSPRPRRALRRARRVGAVGAPTASRRRRARLGPGCLNAPVELDGLYTEVRDRWLEAMALAGPGGSTAPVPACPQWTVHDVTAHVAGLAGDVTAGTLPAMDLLEQWRDEDVARTRDDLTANQVARAHDERDEALIARWIEATARLAPMLRGEVPFPGTPLFGIAPVVVTDLTVHAQDVLAALGAPQITDGAPVSLAVATYGYGVDYRIRRLGLDGLVVCTGDTERVLGDPDRPSGARLTAGRFEVLRALAGRRSRAQIAALDWQGDPEPYLAIIPAYGERDEPLAD
jgi:hypothetical protein